MGKFNDLYNLITRDQKKKEHKKADNTIQTKVGTKSKYGVDPVTTKQGEFEISSELDPQVVRDIYDDYEDEYEYELSDFAPKKSSYTPSRRRSSEPTEDELKDIEQNIAEPTQVLYRKKNKDTFVPKDKDSKEYNEFIKARKAKYLDGFKMMGRDIEESKQT